MSGPRIAAPTLTVVVVLVSRLTLVKLVQPLMPT